MKLQIQQPKNLTMQNLCNDTLPPIGTQNLLGLGLKYCVAPPKPSYNIKECLKKMAYRIRTKQYLIKNNTQPRTEYIPQLYVKLKNWHPPPAFLTIENKLTDFEKQIRQAVDSNYNKTQPYTNLTPLQKTTLRDLKHSTEFVIMPTDKKLWTKPLEQRCLHHTGPTRTSSLYNLSTTV
jgi:hypothetical protein